jgi:hypothetical protein
MSNLTFPALGIGLRPPRQSLGPPKLLSTELRLVTLNFLNIKKHTFRSAHAELQGDKPPSPGASPPHAERGAPHGFLNQIDVLTTARSQRKYISPHHKGEAPCTSHEHFALCQRQLTLSVHHKKNPSWINIILTL